MEAPHEGAEQDLRFDVANAVVGVVGSRRVVDRQEHPRDRLEEKQEERGRAEDVDPGRAPRDWLVEQCLLDRFQLEPAVQPCVKPGEHQISTCCLVPDLNSLYCTSSRPFSILTGRRSSGRGAGPPTTFPFWSNSLPWQGHLNFFSPPSHRKPQPRCVQMGEKTVTSFVARRRAQTPLTAAASM